MDQSNELFKAKEVVKCKKWINFNSPYLSDISNLEGRDPLIAAVLRNRSKSTPKKTFSDGQLKAKVKILSLTSISIYFPVSGTWKLCYSPSESEDKYIQIIEVISNRAKVATYEEMMGVSLLLDLGEPREIHNEC